MVIGQFSLPRKEKGRQQEEVEAYTFNKGDVLQNQFSNLLCASGSRVNKKAHNKRCSGGEPGCEDIGKRAKWTQHENRRCTVTRGSFYRLVKQDVVLVVCLFLWQFLKLVDMSPAARDGGLKGTVLLSPGTCQWLLSLVMFSFRWRGKREDSVSIYWCQPYSNIAMYNSSSMKTAAFSYFKKNYTSFDQLLHLGYNWGDYGECDGYQMVVSSH